MALKKLYSSVQAMPARDMNEAHRPATSLELLFDLVSVIAIAAAAAGLHHAIAEGHLLHGLISFSAAFFMIWWAWMNYTWFASAYDNDDVLFRLLTMVIMAGSLTMAAGINDFFERQDLVLTVIGFIIMRMAMATFWVRAAINDKARRKTASIYAVGILVVQVYWIAVVLLSFDSSLLFWGLFGLGVILELLVPYLAERQVTTPWHRHHIIERYGLLTIIVLGETLLAGTLAISKINIENLDIGLIRVAVSSLVILFAMWWLYFSKEEHISQNSLSAALTWGYGHFIVFMSGAAVGAGFAALVDIVSHHAHVGMQVGLYAVAIPVAAYWFGLWFVRDRKALHASAHSVLLLSALLMLAVPLFLPLEGLAALCVLSVMIRSHMVKKED